MRPDNRDEGWLSWESTTVVGLTVLALATRMYGIWDWSIIGDEYSTVFRAAERARGLHQPAYYVLVVLFTDLFGQSAWAARLPSVLLGTVSVPVFYGACRYVLGRRPAFVGSLFIVVHGWHLYHSQLARFYSAVFLFAVLSYFLYYKALREDSIRYLIASLFSSLMGILFHATAVLVPAACAVFSLFVWSRSDKEVEGMSTRVARIHSLIAICVGFAALPYFFWIAGDWGVQNLTSMSAREPIIVLSKLISHIEPVVLVAALFGGVYLMRVNRLRGIFFGTGIVIPLVGLVVAALVVPPVRAKYVISILPLLIALAAYGCTAYLDAASRISDGMVRYLAPALVVVALLPGFVSYYTGKTSLDLRDVLVAIESEYRPGDQIVAFSRSVGYQLEEQYSDENLNVLGSKAIWRRTLIPLEEDHQRAWVVVDVYRNQDFDDGLHAWLMDHATLVWRRYEKRYDFSVMGYEIYLIGQR